jgi:predicted RNase H-like nuclease (RuvC/YqgF family)
LNNFFQRLQEKDLVVNLEGMKKTIKTNMGKKSVGEILSAAITAWKYNPIDWIAMEDLENAINGAFLCNAISEGEGLITKNRKLQEKVSQLEKEIEVLGRKLERSEQKVAEWEKEYGFAKGKHYQGDVGLP